MVLFVLGLYYLFGNIQHICSKGSFYWNVWNIMLFSGPFVWNYLFKQRQKSNLPVCTYLLCTACLQLYPCLESVRSSWVWTVTCSKVNVKPVINHTSFFLTVWRPCLSVKKLTSVFLSGFKGKVYFHVHETTKNLKFVKWKFHQSLDFFIHPLIARILWLKIHEVRRFGAISTRMIYLTLKGTLGCHGTLQTIIDEAFTLNQLLNSPPFSRPSTNIFTFRPLTTISV